MGQRQERVGLPISPLIGSAPLLTTGAAFPPSAAARFGSREGAEAATAGPSVPCHPCPCSLNPGFLLSLSPSFPNRFPPSPPSLTSLSFFFFSFFSFSFFLSRFLAVFFLFFFELPFLTVLFSYPFLRVLYL